MARMVLLADLVPIQPSGQFTYFSYTLTEPANFLEVEVQDRHGYIVWEEILYPPTGAATRGGTIKTPQHPGYEPSYWKPSKYDYFWGGRNKTGDALAGSSATAQYYLTMVANVGTPDLRPDDTGGKGNGNGSGLGKWGLAAALVAGYILLRGA